MRQGKLMSYQNPPPSGGYPPPPPPPGGPWPPPPGSPSGGHHFASQAPEQEEWRRQARRREKIAAVIVVPLFLVAIIASAAAGGSGTDEAGTTDGTTIASDPADDCINTAVGEMCGELNESTGCVITQSFGEICRDGSPPSTTTTAAPTTTTTEPLISSGVYQVGAEVAPGTYRVVGYWARLDAAQEIIDNDVTQSGTTILDLLPTDVYVEINGEAQPIEYFPNADPMVAGWTDGTYLVGPDIAPGQYRVLPDTTSGSAYWARLDRNHEIIDNNLSEGQLIVDVQPGDYLLNFTGTLERM
jgi:hypothetical protein